MPAPKGARNADAYQKAIVEETKAKIVDVLNTAARSGVVFQNVSTLADYLAPQVGRSASRLRRNLVYRVLLERHLSRQRGAAAIIDARDRDIDTLKAKLRAAQLENSTLLRDRNRLAALIAKHLPDLQGGVASHQRPEIPKADEAAEFRAAFESTAEVLAALLARVAEFGYEVDHDAGRIVDRDARPGHEEVSSPAKSRWFIEWLESRR